VERKDAEINEISHLLVEKVKNRKFKNLNEKCNISMEKRDLSLVLGTAKVQRSETEHH